MKQFNAEMFTPNEFSLANWSNAAVADPAAARRLIWRFAAASVMTDVGWIAFKFIVRPEEALGGRGGAAGGGSGRH